MTSNQQQSKSVVINSSSYDTAEEVFNVLHQKIVGVLSDSDTDSSKLVDEDHVQHCLQLIAECHLLIAREALFSNNEELLDIQTPYLKYFFLDYYKAKCRLWCKDLERRFDSLLLAKEAIIAFLKSCFQYEFLDAADKQRVEQILSAADETVDEDKRRAAAPVASDLKRNYKIEKYKKDKAARIRINELQRLLYIARGDPDEDYSAERRELSITQLQCYARTAIDDIDILEQELPMLQMLREQRAQQQLQQQQRGGGAEVDSRIAAAASAPRQGITVMKTFKVGDQVMFSRETVKSTVFGSHIAPPTMTLEEFADLELKDAEERAAAQADAAANAGNAPRRYRELEAAGVEDDDVQVEQSALKDRQWDNWKDDNPRGSGNKMGKRF